MRNSTRYAAALGAVTALVLAGCASTIAGNAEPVGSVAVSSAPVPSSQAPASTGALPVPASSAAAPGSSAPVTPSTGAGTADTSAPPASSGPASSGAAGSSGAPTTYPTTPAQLITTPRSAEGAALLEAQRIAGALVVPTFIDPTLVAGSISTRPYGNAQGLTTLFSDPVPSVAQRAGMVSGFSSSRSDSNQNNLIVAAFEFPSAAAATTAATQLAAAAANKGKDKGKAAIPGYPAAAGWYGAFSSDYGYYQAFLAQGTLVLYVWVTGPKLNTPALQAARIANSLKVETAAMAKFVPTPAAKLMQLPIDPTGLEAHTLLNTGDNATIFDGVMTAAGQLHYDSDPIGTQKLFAAAGVDLVSDGRANVYRAKDTGGAAIIRDGFIADTQKSSTGWTPYTLTAAVPDASCLQQALNSTFYCVGVTGRYAFEVSAQTASDLNSAMAAQLAILKGF